MKCIHTKRHFAVVITGYQPKLFVLPAQLDEVRSVLIRNAVVFVVNHEGVYTDNQRFRVICFRPDADTTAIEKLLAKA